MHNVTPKEPTELFHHLPHHRVLICKQCRYAVQPSAVSRHLKELHHMYRSDRQQFVDYALGLDLADQHNVILPEPGQHQLPFLPIIPGLSCALVGCGYMCATDKRMKIHWRTEHSSAQAHQPQGYRVCMQTFFRGNQLQYFIVRPLSATSSLEQGTNKVHASNTGPPDTVPPDTVPSSEQHVTITEAAGLIHHFHKTTCFESGLEIVDQIFWSSVVPELEATTPFLQHGIIACAALHLAVLHPSRKQQYHLIAANHQDLALPEFRSAIKNPNADNYLALFIFTHLLIMHCFAVYEDKEDLLLVQGQDELMATPDWLQIIRGTCYAFLPVSKYIKILPNVFTTMEVDVSEPPVEKSSYDVRLHGLLDLLHSHVSQNIDGFSDGSCHLLLSLYRLSRALALAEKAHSQSIYSLWVALYIWPVRVSQEYLALLKQRHPIALILLAHYCILLRPLETNWYMSGYTKKLMRHIQSQLSQEWRPWLRWPLEEIGVTDDEVCTHSTASKHN